jgi:hypothetical protein
MPIKKLIDDHPYISYNKLILSDHEMLEHAQSFYKKMENRRSVREFSDRPISRKVIENIIKLPRQRHQVLISNPWTFIVVANPEIKKTNSVAAEEEER